MEERGELHWYRMRLTLDECLDVRLAEAFLVAGHGVQTARQENLSGLPDQVIYATCIQEGRRGKNSTGQAGSTG